MTGKELNHKSQSSTAIYARLNVDPLREVLEGVFGGNLNGQEQKTIQENAINK